jgi:hypothetical protein
LIRRANDRDTFALLVDLLPPAIEAGYADHIIALLKFWGAWNGLYPGDKAAQALVHAADHNAAAVDSP